MMTDIRIVCAHDAVKLADMLMRLLDGEQHQVQLLVGRQSLTELEAAKTARDAVLLIWSANAPSQHYMREWARHIRPGRLIEIARAPGWPEGERKAPVIDFTAWRGQRNSRAWSSLKERLRLISRGLDPPTKSAPKRAAMALGIAGIAAVSGAAFVRMQEPAPGIPIAAPEPTDEIVATVETAVNVDFDGGAGVGGPLGTAAEPPSAGEIELLAHPQFDAMPASRVEIPVYVAPELRAPTLLERLSALNPLRNISFSDDDEDEGG